MSTANELLDTLREKLWTDGAHAWIYEVANATGMRASRFADALVCSCWPSRGLWLAGIEVKVSRSDWTRERDTPQKSAPLQKYCRYWWLVTTPGVARTEEIPELWGHIEVKGAKHKIMKAAPELTPEPPTIDLVASITRNAAKSIDHAVTERAHKLIETERDLLRDEREKLATLNRTLGKDANVIKSYQDLLERCKKFRESTGLDILHEWRLSSSIETIQLSEKLTGFKGIHQLRKELARMSDLLGDLDVEKSEAAE